MPILMRFLQMTRRLGPTPNPVVLSNYIEAELSRLGKFSVDELRSRIPPGATKGSFPGDGPPSGRLKSSFRFSKPHKSSEKEWSTTISVDKAQVKKYWYVHEAGKTISAKAMWGMIFTYRGKRWQVPRVTITPKWYIRDSISATQTEIRLNLVPHIRRGIEVSIRMDK